jgi:hypothetical protein
MDLSSSSRVSSFRVPNSFGDNDITSLMELAPWAKRKTVRQINTASMATPLASPSPQSPPQSPPEAIWAQPVEYKEPEKKTNEEEPIAQSSDSPPPSWQELLEGQSWLKKKRQVVTSQIVLTHEPQPEVRPEAELGNMGDMLAAKHIVAPLHDLIAQKVFVEEPVSEPDEPVESVESVEHVESVEPVEHNEEIVEEAVASIIISEVSEVSFVAKEVAEIAIPVEPEVSIPLLPEAPITPVVSEEKPLIEVIVQPITPESAKPIPIVSPAPLPSPKPVLKPADKINSIPPQNAIPVEDLMGGLFSLVGSGVRGASSFFKRKLGSGK